MTQLKHNLRYLRKKKGETQATTGTALGITQTAIANYENGVSNPKIEELPKIAKYFNISIDDLLTRDLVNEKTPGSIGEDQASIKGESNQIPQNFGQNVSPKVSATVSPTHKKGQKEPNYSPNYGGGDTTVEESPGYKPVHGYQIPNFNDFFGDLMSRIIGLERNVEILVDRTGKSVKGTDPKEMI